MQPRLSRFGCPRCAAPLTPWLRELTLPEARATLESETWMLPGGTFVHRDGALLAGRLAVPVQGQYPWLLAPLGPAFLREHPEAVRTIGCCGLSFVPGLPNLVCPCGQEVGFGYRDCCNPHWYALHASVTVEQRDDPAPSGPPDERLAQARALVAGALPAVAAWPANRPHVEHADPSTWRAAPRLRDLGLQCGGGVESPLLMFRSTQLPRATALVVPIPWAQLVRFMVLAEEPAGCPDVPLTWQFGARDAPTVQVARSGTTVLITVWQREHTWAVRISASRWRKAWMRLRRRAAGRSLADRRVAT